MPTTALIGLGSNLGKRRTILESAIAALAEFGSVEGVSTLRETAPVGGPPGQGPFLNAALRLLTSLPPHQLHDRLRALESAAGRVRRVRWGERTLDLDLLLYGDQVIDTPDLAVPHPRFAVRRFVLGPLAEIAGEICDPLTGLTMRELLANIDRRPSCVALDCPDFQFLDSLIAQVEKSLSKGGQDGGSPWIVTTWRGLDSVDGGAYPHGLRATFVASLGPLAAREKSEPHPPLPWLVVRTDRVEEATAEVVAACVATRTGS